ncbi:MAG: hypothetical protein ACI841_000810 [Planctomycetota bacterium]|jgi:hypothetical protein
MGGELQDSFSIHRRLVALPGSEAAVSFEKTARFAKLLPHSLCH